MKIARSVETIIAGKKSGTILTLKEIVQRMIGLAQKTIGVLRWMFHFIIPLGGYCRGFMEEMDLAMISAACQVAFSIAPVDRETATKHVWSGRKIDLGWMVLRATMLVMRSSSHLRLLRECSPGPGPCQLVGKIQRGCHHPLSMSSRA